MLEFTIGKNYFGKKFLGFRDNVFSFEKNSRPYGAILPQSLNVSEEVQKFITGFSGQVWPGITDFTLKRCKKLKALDLSTFPQSLKNLVIINCGITKLTGNSAFQLELLNLKNCAKLKDLGDAMLETPPKKLDIAGSGIRKIKKRFAEGLESIRLEYLTQSQILNALPLPASLKRLDVEMSNVTKLKKCFPEGLEIINLESLSLETLESSKFPKSLKELKLDHSVVKILKEKFSEGLEKLYLKSCNELKTLDVSILPASLEKLELEECGINNFAGGRFSEGLKHLCIYSCKELKTLDVSILPDSLEKLELGFFRTKISLTGVFPPGLTKLKSLNLTNCSRLTYSVESYSQLQELEKRGCVVTYPAHFDLAREIERAMQEIPPECSRNAKELFSRLISEDLERRGGIKEVRGFIEPVIKHLKENPRDIEIVESIASQFLAACINQPTAGFAKIAAWIDVARQQTLKEKLEKAKVIYVQDQLENYFAALPADKRPRQSFEAEARNALLREVHAMLLQNGDISQPWLGVPNYVASEGAISSWLTPSRVEEFYNIAKEELKVTSEKLTNILCETNHVGLWGRAAFGKELREVLEKRQALDSAKTALIGAELSQDNIDEELKDLNAEDQLRLKEFVDKLRKDSSEAGLAAIGNEIVQERDAAINECVKLQTKKLVAGKLSKTSVTTVFSASPLLSVFSEASKVSGV